MIFRRVSLKSVVWGRLLVAIAAIRAVFDYFDQELSQETLEMLVHQAETIAIVNLAT